METFRLEGEYVSKTLETDSFEGFFSACEKLLRGPRSIVVVYCDHRRIGDLFVYSDGRVTWESVR